MLQGEKVAQILKSCQNVAEQLVESPRKSFEPGTRENRQFYQAKDLPIRITRFPVRPSLKDSDFKKTDAHEEAGPRGMYGRQWCAQVCSL